MTTRPVTTPDEAEQTHDFDRVEPFWIPLKDGVRLSARLWLPRDSQSTPVGAVIEYLPYRTRDLFRALDDQTGDRIAGGGFAFIRVDIRGSGESGGLIGDEFEDSQTDDLVEVIEWIATQPWCSGSVGVRGYSWGGNAALYAAARHPEPLKAVIACCACGDRFGRDLHWHGGALGHDNIFWASALNTVLGMPPDPAIVGDGWRDEWRRRLENIGPTGARWVSHQRADEYWAESSPGPYYDSVRCPIYYVGGTQDGWVDEVDHVLSGMQGPRKGMIGPWGHSFPQNGVPGPQIDWLAEELRWWGHWLGGGDSSIMDEPMLTAFVQDCAVAQVGSGTDVPGQWVDVESWPPNNWTTMHLTDGGLTESAASAVTLPIPDKGVVGIRWREWSSPDKGAADLQGDQASDDAKSLVFDSDVLDEDLVILGRPRLSLRVAADSAVAFVGVRLTEVTDDGGSWPVTFGMLNLTHRHGSEHPAPLTPGQAYDVDIDLRFVARRLNVGSRLRVALSSTFWPMMAAPPERTSLVVEAGAASRLALPLLPDAPARTSSAEPELVTDRAVSVRIEVTEDVEPGGQIRVTKTTHETRTPLEGVGTVGGYSDKSLVTIDDRDPRNASWHRQVTRTLSWPDIDTEVSVTATCQLDFSPDTYHVTETILATEDGSTFYENTIATDVPRALS